MRTLSLLLLIFTMSLASNTRSDDSGPVAVDPSIALTEKQVKELETLTIKGDATAAFRLYLHHTIALQQEAAGRKWLDKAAELGHPIAQYNLARIYLDDPKKRDLEKALIWLKKAAAQGVEEAKSELQRLNKLK
jgi:TPR repeat protein